MDEQLNDILLDLFGKYIRGEPIQTDYWTAKFPQYDAEIRSYISRLESNPGLASARTAEAEAAADRALFRAVSTRAIARERLRRADRELGARIERARAAGSRRHPSTDADWFPKFAVFAWIVVLLHEANGYTKRFRAQKVAFLVEEALGLQLFVDHERFAAGRYDWRLRYEKSGEPYAKSIGWFEVEAGRDGEESDRYRILAPSRAAEEKARRHLADPDLTREIVYHLAEALSDELETLVTVADVAKELESRGELVTTDTVLSTLPSIPEYAHKVKLDYFSASHIRDALIRLRDLRILPAIPEPEDEDE